MLNQLITFSPQVVPVSKSNNAKTIKTNYMLDPTQKQSIMDVGNKVLDTYNTVDTGLFNSD